MNASSTISVTMAEERSESYNSIKVILTSPQVDHGSAASAGVYAVRDVRNVRGCIGCCVELVHNARRTGLFSLDQVDKNSVRRATCRQATPVSLAVSGDIPPSLIHPRHGRTIMLKKREGDCFMMFGPKCTVVTAFGLNPSLSNCGPLMACRLNRLPYGHASV